MSVNLTPQKSAVSRQCVGKTDAFAFKELAGAMENRLALRIDEAFVYSRSGRPHRRVACRDRSELHEPRLPYLKQVTAKGNRYTYFKRPGRRVRVPNVGELGFENAYLNELALIEGAEVEPYEPPVRSVAYFVQPASGGPIKIGFARHMAKRLASLQTANHERLVVLATVRGPESVEREYHRKFAEHRLHGEWFEPHPDILAEIERLKADAPQLGQLPQEATHDR